MKKILYIIIFFLLINCKSCEKGQVFENKKGFNFEGCGECLNLDTGRVCTIEGTYYNSCLAICKQVKILCNGECPCPKKNN
jgi:hypothetical protein